MTGELVSIPIIVKDVKPINGFNIYPESWSSDVNKRILNWSDADKYCRSIGKRLPTVRQVQTFVSYYNRIVKNGAPKILGLPSSLDGSRPMCGGLTEAYWTSENMISKNIQYYKVASINNDADYANSWVLTSEKVHVMCVSLTCIL